MGTTNEQPGFFIVVKDHKKWVELRRSQTTEHGMTVFHLARDWGMNMQLRMDVVPGQKAPSVEDVAYDCLMEALTPEITPLMVGQAVAILTEHWAHGPELHNSLCRATPAQNSD